jgi:hypothetical protein
MPETPKKIRVLLASVAVVVLLAVGAVVGVIVAQLAQTGDTSRPAVARTPEPQPETSPVEVTSTTPAQRVTKQPLQPKEAKKTPDRPIQAAQPIESPKAPPVHPDILGSGRNVIVITSGQGKIPSGMVLGKSGDVSTLRAAHTVKSLDLSKAQKTAVAKFDEMFQANITQQTEHDEQARKDVARGLEDAIQSGDKQLISMAQEQAMEIAKEQAKAIDRLNEQYADGVRQYLTTAQEAKLDKALQQKTPVRMGYVTVKKDDGTMDVRVLQPSMSVQPGSTDDN